jgi:hypothetical protein
MRCSVIPSAARNLQFLLLAACSLELGAQQQAGAPSRDELALLARTQLAITAAHDSSNKELSKSGNKTDKAQSELKAKFQARVTEILHHSGMTEAQYRRGTFLVSTDTGVRRLFDSITVALSGAPLPGAVQRTAQLPVPPGPAGVHAGHVANAFDDTPNLGWGLLPTAIAEARVAQQHATLATRMPDNLEYMKTHSGHVLHALDPASIPGLMAPGLGYGVKKAANGVITHIELAGAAPGAPQQIELHSKHIAIAGRNTLVRVDQIIALAQKVRAATTAAEAASLVSQMAALADQLMAGTDANSDGRITWEMGEGGLQHADDHIRMMLRPAP